MLVTYKLGQRELRTVEELDQFWKELQDELEQTGEIPYMIRQGELEVYEDLYQTLRDNLTVEPIQMELVIISQEQLVREVRESLEQYLSRVLSQLEPLADPFYGEVSSEHWSNLGILLEGLDWMLQSWSGLLPTFPASFQQHALAVQQTFEQVTRQLLEEMERQNHTGIGDCLLYELQPLLEEMQRVLGGIGV